MRSVGLCGVFCGFVLWLSGCGNSVEIIAHRGASYVAPENTLAAVRLGWQQGADVEIDVHLSGDQRIVVIHDASTKRTGELDLKVKETGVPELRALDVGRFKAEEFAGERIPFLDEVLAALPPGRRLYIEIKCGPEVLPLLHAQIRASGKISRIVIIGFGLETVAASKRLLDVPTYWLKGTEKVKDTEQWIPHDPNLVQRAREKGLDGLDVHYAGVTPEFARAVKVSGLKFYVWTVDDPQEAIRLVKLGVDGITTNRPAWLRDQLRQQASIRQRTAGSR
jgi:glycerophosphoryl diester phosphodiesterase